MILSAGKVLVATFFYNLATSENSKSIVKPQCYREGSLTCGPGRNWGNPDPPGPGPPYPLCTRIRTARVTKPHSSRGENERDRHCMRGKSISNRATSRHCSNQYFWVLIIKVQIKIKVCVLAIQWRIQKFTRNLQESCAITKMTARCALYK